MTLFRKAACLFALLGLAACQSTSEDGAVTRVGQSAPDGAEPGTCWGQLIEPALIETVTEQVLVEPEARGADGGLVSPAVYRTQTRQEIVRDRQTTWFQTLCPDQMTVEFVASLQRALAARDYYRGPITGDLDTRTKTALRRYQTPLGYDNSALALDAARSLGLIAVELPES